MADAVMNATVLPATTASAATAPSIQRMCTACAEEQADQHQDTIQRGADATGGSIAAGAAIPTGAGAPLAAPVRDVMESRFGHDFSRVRIHTDGPAQASARALRARAYTLGSDVFFAGGQYAPETRAGGRLLAHELAHVVQQGRGAHLLQREPDDGGRAPDAGPGPSTGPAIPTQGGGSPCGITVPTDADTQLLAGAVFAEADPKTTGNTEREEIAGVFYNRVEHVFFLCNGGICTDLSAKQRTAQCTRDTADFGANFVDAVKKGSVAFGNSRWNLVMSSTTMKSAATLCKLPQSEINAVIAAIDAATTIMGAGANDDAVAFNKGAAPSSRMQKLKTIGKHNFHHFKDGRECG
jgi:hypothetical protein